MTEKIRFANPVVFVKDVEVSKKFYAEVVGLKIIEDSGVFVLFEDHFSIHQARELLDNVFKKGIQEDIGSQGKNNLLLYFETDEIEAKFARIKDQVKLIHPIEKQSWGQKVFRFYDPDGHLVEIGEPMVYQF